MNLSLILMILAGISFVLEALDVDLGTFSPKWWALGVAFYLFAQVA